MAGRRALRVGELGSISVEQVGGRVSARARTRDAGGTVRRLRATAADRDDALASLRRQAAELSLSVQELGPDARLGTLLELWLQDSSKLRIGTRRAYADTSRWLTAIAGEVTIGDLTTLRAKRLLQKIEIERSESAAVRARTALSGAINVALEAGAISSNPLAGLRRRTREPEPTVHLEPDQVDALRAAAARRADELRQHNLAWPDMPSRVIELMLGSGLRVGEALALRHMDVDLSGGVASVTGTLVDDAKWGVVRQEYLKRAAQARRIVLPRFAVDALAAARADCQTIQARLPSAPAFPSREGTWIAPRNFRRTLREIRADPEFVRSLATTGLKPEQVTPHILRRTVATLLGIEDGNLVRAQAVLGHSDERTTRSHYAGVAYRTVGDADALERLIGAGRRATIS